VLCRQAAHDVRTDMPVAAPWIGVGAGCVLLFEGLFLFRRELNAYWDYRILIDIDLATSLSRALARDADVIGPADIVRRKSKHATNRLADLRQRRTPGIQGRCNCGQP